MPQTDHGFKGGGETWALGARPCCKFDWASAWLRIRRPMAGGNSAATPQSWNPGSVSESGPRHLSRGLSNDGLRAVLRLILSECCRAVRQSRLPFCAGGGRGAYPFVQCEHIARPECKLGRPTHLPWGGRERWQRL